MVISTIAPLEAYNQDGSLNADLVASMLDAQNTTLTSAQAALLADSQQAALNQTTSITHNVADISAYLSQQQAVQNAIYDVNASALANYANTALNVNSTSINTSTQTLSNALNVAMQRQSNVLSDLQTSILATTGLLSQISERLLSDDTVQDTDSSPLASQFRDYIEASDSRLERILTSLRDTPQQLILGFGSNGDISEDDTITTDDNPLRDVLIGLLDSGFLGGVPALEETISNVIPDFGPILESVEDRLSFLHELNMRFQRGEIETLEELESEMFRGAVAGSIGDGLIRLINILPFIYEVIQSFSANSTLQLDRIVKRSIRPQLLDINTLIIAYHRNFIDRDILVEYLQTLGYSNEDILRLIASSHQRYTTTDGLELLRRKEITENQFKDNLSDIGYTDNQQNELTKLRWFVPPVQDIIRMAVRDVFSPTIVAQGGLFNDLPPEFVERAELSGLDAETAKLYWGAHWVMPSIQQGYEMFHRGVISDIELDTLFKAVDIAPLWRDKLKQISFSMPTRVDTRRMFEDGIIDESQLRGQLKDWGYSPDNVNRMAQWYVSRRDARNNQVSTTTRDLTYSLILRAYSEGIIDENRARQKLAEIGYTPQDIAIIIETTNSQLNDITGIDYTKEIRNDYKKIAEKYYKHGSITEQTTRQFLGEAGLSNDEISAFISLWELEIELARKDAILTQVQKLYIGYEIDENGLRDILSNYGFSSPEIDERIIDFEPFRKLRYKDLTRSDVKKALSIGIISTDEALNQYRGLGYSDKDIEIILSIEQGGNV